MLRQLNITAKSTVVSLLFAALVPVMAAAQRHGELERPRRRDEIAGEISDGVRDLPPGPQGEAAAQEMHRRCARMTAAVEAPDR